MGARGPKKMPDNVRILTGNRGKRPLTNNGGMIALDIEAPDCPAHLSAEAKKEWKRIAPELLKMRVLTKIDRAALESYCENYALWVRACMAINALQKRHKDDDGAGLIDLTPNGFKQMSVWLQIRNRASQDMRSAAAEFGMSPANRVKIQEAQVPEQNDLFQDDKPDPERFFGGHRSST